MDLSVTRILVILAAVAVFAVYVTFQYLRWSRVANAVTLGIAWDITGPCGVSGEREGVKVSACVMRGEWRFTIEARERRREQRRYTHYQADVSEMIPDGFEVSTEGLGSKVGKFLGMQDVETGLDAFDYVFVVKARDAAKARAFVRTPGVADALLDFQNHHTDMTLKRGVIEVSHSGTDDTPTIEHTLNRMVHLAKVLEHATSGPTTVSWGRRE